MLILTRRIGDTINIGKDISCTLLGVKDNQVRIGLAAPRGVDVHREEIFLRVNKEKQKMNLPIDYPQT